MTKEGSSPRVKTDQIQTTNEDEVVVVAATGHTVRQSRPTKHRSDGSGDHNFDNINSMAEENDALPREQVEMLLRENEEIRRQIAEVRNHMDQSMVNMANQTAAAVN